MLEIKKLKVGIKTVEQKSILDDLDLSIESNKIHLLMGPNGAGKSTLGKAVMNWPEFDISGQVIIEGEDITALDLSERAKKGLFLAHQSPVEIPGVHLVEFVRTAYNNMRPEAEHMDPWSFKDMFEAVSDEIGLGSEFSERSLNDGFSGGEKRKNEILQMLLLKPKYAILDEIDSGLDLDSLVLVFNAISKFVKETGAGILVISHNPKILEYIKPDTVSLLMEGEITSTGGIELAEEIIKGGYATYSEKQY